MTIQDVEIEASPIGEFAEYQEFSRQKLREVLTRELGRSNDETYSHHDHDRKEELIKTVLDCQETVFQDFKRNHDVEKPGTPQSTMYLDDDMAKFEFESNCAEDENCLQNSTDIFSSDTDARRKMLSPSSGDNIIALPDHYYLPDGWANLPPVPISEVLPDLASDAFGEFLNISGWDILSEFPDDPFLQNCAVTPATPKAAVLPEDEMEDGVSQGKNNQSGNQNTMPLQSGLSLPHCTAYSEEDFCDEKFLTDSGDNVDHIGDSCKTWEPH